MKKSFLFFLSLFVFANFAISQTVLISPTGDGGFENGNTFADNGWTVSNSTNNPWFVGVPGGTTNPAAPMSGNKAFVSNDAGLTRVYSNTSACQNYFWRDITVPAGETKIVLSFDWNQQGENSYDIIQVFVAPTSITPVGSTTFPGFGTGNVPTAIAGATFVANTSVMTGNQVLTIALPPSLAGTTFRLIFLWKNDTSGGTQPPAAIDNISLISGIPGNVTSTQLGGLWNSPDSWVGGVVPAGDHVTIVQGATIVVNQTVNIGDLTVNGKIQWLTTTAPSSTVNLLTASNITISNTGELLAHGSTTAGASVLVSGNFTNNGLANFAVSGSSLRFIGTTGTQTLGGTGTFVSDMLGRGFIQNLWFMSTASCVINTSQDLVTANLAHTAGSLNTNGKISIDNTAISFGNILNRSIYTVIVNTPGVAYTSEPTVTFTAAPAGGTTATGIANIDPVTGTLRSITITNPGDGYRATPTITLAGGGATTQATAVAILYQNLNSTSVGTGQKSAIATVTGGININNNQGVGSVFVTNGGLGYTSEPTVGFALPISFINLVTNGGSGYTSAPTVTFSGGGGSGATATAIVTRGQVTSVHITAGGTNYTSTPTITITGGGGSGATAEIPANMLPTATASIDPALGMITHFTVTNPGYGYLTTNPTVTLTGGGFTTAASSPTSRIGNYNLTLSWFAPSTVNSMHTESEFIPSNRRIHALTLNSVPGVSFNNNIELYALTPLATFAGPIDMNGNTLTFSHPSYIGNAGTAAAYVMNGSIAYRLNGSTTAQTRTFPFNAFNLSTGHLISMGNAPAVATDGSTITLITATETAVSTSANMIGTRGLKIQTNGMYGTNPTLRLSWNAIDNLGGAEENLFVGQASTLNGVYTPRSLASGTTAMLGATGSRTTATTGVGPIVDGEEYFGWYSTWTPPAVDFPTAVSATAISDSQINLAFTPNAANNNVVIIWSTDNTSFTLPTGTPPAVGQAFAGGTVLSIGNTSPVLHTGLNANTQYYYKLHSYNGSLYSPGISATATTLCGAVTVPYTENFENAVVPALPACTSREKIGLANDWITALNPGSGFTSKTLRYGYHLTIAANAWFYTQGIQLSTGVTYRLEFRYGNNSTTYSEKLKVHIGNNPSNTAMSVTPLLDFPTINQNAPQNAVVDFTVPTTGVYYLGFNCYSNADQFNLYLDDISVVVSPTCPAPTALAAASVTHNSASLSWVNSATAFKAEIGAVGFTPGTGTSLFSVNNHPTTTWNATGLNASTNYHFFVKAICAVGDSSTWAGPFAFATACGSISPAWNENFNAATFPPLCWERAKGVLADPVAFTSTTTSSWVADGFANVGTTGAARINIFGTSPREWLITPSIDLGTGSTTYQLEFDLALTAYNNSNPPALTGTDDKFAVVISTDNGATWSSVNTLKLWDNAGSLNVYNNISNTGERIVISLAGYSGLVKFGFYGESTLSNADNDLFIDSVSVVASPVTIISATINPDSVTFIVNEPSNLETFVTWNSAATVTSIVDNQTTPYTLTATDYSVAGNAITLNQAYLTTLLPSAGLTRLLTINFNVGNPAILTVGSTTTVDVNELGNNIVIYPNPSNGEFSVVANDTYMMSIYDISGRLIQVKEIYSGTNEIKMLNNASGVYTVKLMNNKQTHSFRIVVK